MKTISTTAIVALMTISAGLTAAAPAMAQDAQPRMQQQQMQHKGDGPGRHFNNQRAGHNGPARGGMLGGLLDFGRDGETIELALVRLSYRIDLTDEQKALLEDFKTAALAAQADFASTVETIRPKADAASSERPDIVARLAQRITLEKAHVDALTAVQPAFEAFFTTLTDAQKAELMPQRNQHTGWRGPKGEQGRHGQRALPGQSAPADAPSDVAAPTING
jgi:hypothetical protein